MQVDSETNAGDKLNLFSPAPEKPPSPPAQDAPADTAAGTFPDEDASAAAVSFYVEVPKLRKEVLGEFHEIPGGWEAADEAAEDSERIVELVGEYTFQGKRYVYAEYRDGIKRRKEDWEFRTSFPELYEDYERRREIGGVEELNPSHLSILPKHRIHPLSIPRSRSKTRASTTSELSDSDGNVGGSRRLRTRQVRYSTRNSSRRTRQTSVESEDDDMYEESESEEELVRRSGRAGTRKNYKEVIDIDYEDIEDSDDDAIEVDSDNSADRKRSKKQKKRKGAKPAYGRIRVLEDVGNAESALQTHRDTCEKCHRVPASVLLQKLKSRKGRKKKKAEDDFSENDEDFYTNLGGWVRCLRCCISAHWRCLSKPQRDDIIRAVAIRAEQKGDTGPKFRELDVEDTTEFICGMCSRTSSCMGCDQQVTEEPTADASADSIPETPEELLFRCISCKRVAHYDHLLVDTDEDMSAEEKAEFFQGENQWQCPDCASYRFPLDKVIAWRPTPPTAVDKHTNAVEKFNYKENLPREYLVKWSTRSYRRLQWVPHMWMVSTQYTKLKNFYEQGPKVPLLEGPIGDLSSYTPKLKSKGTLFATEDESSRAESLEAEAHESRAGAFPTALHDAELRIPPLWRTVERVLDLRLRKPSKPARTNKGKRIVEDEESEEDELPNEPPEMQRVFDYGEEPDDNLTETVEEFERRAGRKLDESDVNNVLWAYLKWDDLPYDESTWDSPPRQGEAGYDEFKAAFARYLYARTVVIWKRTPPEIEALEKRTEREKWSTRLVGITSPKWHDIGQSKELSLMPFQITGVNWLCKNWFNWQSCILADEMGLGKTVQVITFIGLLQSRLEIVPTLVVVPNSTITNWVREFSKWAPKLRVVPFYGEQASREIIKNYELRHSIVDPKYTGAKYHVLIATYEAVTSQKDFAAVFKKTPRWEALIVDEGQRLKNDSSLIFKRLNELNTYHRVIMTGTPLNNNIRELFNLMNFLDPNEWADLEALEKEFEELDEERIKEMHERLRPYFLRRVKADVLDLPPKNEIIVPLSMAPLQKEIYKSLLSNNLSLLKNLQLGPNAKTNKTNAPRSNLRNLLMQLRKCLQHPYLIDNDIEPKDLTIAEAHTKLIDASGKLRFLKMLLPKLKERGHRVLLFSQFVIGLNIVCASHQGLFLRDCIDNFHSEDFLQGEGYKFLRLDGNKKQAERQKDMDKFNSKDSDVFIYILSTRAGGVGINLWSADTVIIFDPDFNPHQDLQAIARAHRYGQKKTVLVFKFMTKTSVEERIMQIGKKKLVLDHLIVQKMDDDEDSGAVQSMLTFGASALFADEQENRDISYTENDVQSLIEKVETEGDQVEATQANHALSFAKVWSAQKGELDEITEAPEGEQDDSWAQTLRKLTEVQTKAQAEEKSGRGVRRKATQGKVNYVFEQDTPTKDKPTRKRKKSASAHSGDSDADYDLPQSRHSSPESSSDPGASDEESSTRKQATSAFIDPFAADADMPLVHDASTYPVTGDKAISAEPSKARSTERKVSGSGGLPESRAPPMRFCGLCGDYHGPGGYNGSSCAMMKTKDPITLSEYRKMLIYKALQSYEIRLEAVNAIDAELERRGLISLVSKQPKLPVKHTHEASQEKAALPVAIRISEMPVRQPPPQPAYLTTMPRSASTFIPSQDRNVQVPSSQFPNDAFHRVSGSGHWTNASSPRLQAPYEGAMLASRSSSNPENPYNYNTAAFQSMFRPAGVNVPIVPTKRSATTEETGPKKFKPAMCAICHGNHQTMHCQKK